MVHSKGQNCFLRLLTQKTSKILNCPDSVLREAKSARGKKFCLVHGLVQILILLFFFFFLGLKFSPTARTVNVQKKRAPPIGPMNLFEQVRATILYPISQTTNLVDRFLLSLKVLIMMIKTRTVVKNCIFRRALWNTLHDFLH